MTRPDTNDLLGTIKWQDELIADLLAACKEACEVLEKLHGYEPLDRWKAAIAKAESTT